MSEQMHRGEQDGHSPEPWRDEDNAPFGLVAADDKPVLMLMDDGKPLILDEDAKRIIACINACTRVPMEDLERWGKWMQGHTAICPDCQGLRVKVITVGLSIDGKMEKWTQIHTPCKKCDGLGKVKQED